MSQFLIGSGKAPIVSPPLAYIPIPMAGSLVQEAARALLESKWISGWQLVDSTGDTISELFDVGWILTAGGDFNSTNLYRVLSLLCSSDCKLYVWYGSDFQNLTEFNEAKLFLKHVKDAVSMVPCEVYASFIPSEAKKSN